MNAGFGLPQGDLELENTQRTAVPTCWCSLSEKLFSCCVSFLPIPYIILALLSPSLPAVE